jgi:hypothetical protein
MPTDETRGLRKVFGVAVTAFEDAVDKDTSIEERRKAEAEPRHPAWRSCRSHRAATGKNDIVIPRLLLSRLALARSPVAQYCRFPRSRLREGANERKNASAICTW